MLLTRIVTELARSRPGPSRRVDAGAALAIGIAAGVLAGGCAKLNSDQSPDEHITVIHQTFRVGMPLKEAETAARGLGVWVRDQDLHLFVPASLHSPGNRCSLVLQTGKPAFSLLALGDTFTVWTDDQDRVAEVWWEVRPALRADQSLLLRAGLMGVGDRSSCDCRHLQSDGVIAEKYVNHCAARHLRYLPLAAPLAELARAPSGAFD